MNVTHEQGRPSMLFVRCRDWISTGGHFNILCRVLSQLAALYNMLATERRVQVCSSDCFFFPDLSLNEITDQTI